MKNSGDRHYRKGRHEKYFISIRDVVSGIKSGMEGNARGTFNIGTGTQTSINDLVEILSSFTKTKISITYVLSRLGEIRDSFADISLAKKELGFRPSYSIQIGLEETVHWFQTRNY